MSGERPDDYRSVPHPDAVERWAKGTLYEWVVCEGCGKEFQREVILEELRDSIVKWCAICDLKHHEERDTCPEGITGLGFGGSCRLKFRHERRCEPWHLDPEIARRVAERRS